MPKPLVHTLLALALLLIANYLWQYGSTPLQDQAPRKADGDPLPTSYIDQARSRSYTEQGVLSDILESERVEQFGRNGDAVLTEPRFYAHSDNNRTWSASAERGRFQPGRQRLLLRQSVVLSHDQTGTRLDSNSLDIHLDSREARSTVPVTISQGGNVTRADGMLARLNQETIALGPNVESIYARVP